MQVLAFSQDSLHSKIYKVNFKYEVPITAVSFALTQYQYAGLSSKTTLTTQEVLALDKNDISKFNRPAFNFPASNYKTSRSGSDYVMYGSMALPTLLLFDKRLRTDWKEFTTMYFQTHTISSDLYLTSALNYKKPRPLAYNTDYPIELRSGESTSNSFFSGHVTTTTASTFFMAKLYCDYHDLSIGQKAIVYTLASIPPAVVASFRMRAGKHFRTDVMTGFLVGATTGILVPELHKRRKNKDLTYIPIVSENMIGLSLNYKF